MRSRSENGRGYNEFSPKYPTKGFAPEWDMCGYVQMVKENEKMKLDYVRFDIEKTDSKYYNIISISVPWDLDVALEPGDAVHIQGTCRSWTRDGNFILELVATSVSPWNGKFEGE